MRTSAKKASKKAMAGLFGAGAGAALVALSVATSAPSVGAPPRAPMPQSGMTLGATVTTTTPPPTPEIAVAKPGDKAKLPKGYGM